MSIWYSYRGIPYSGSCTAYYDLRSLDWFNKLSSSLRDIQKATLELLHKGDIADQPYFNTEILQGKGWDAIPFMFWKDTYKEEMTKGDSVVSYFRDIPGLVSLSVSMLQPATHIRPHYGDTDAIWRLHIPIYIPSTLPECGLRVNNIDRGWQEDEIIVFCDGHLHEAWNQSDKVRVVIIADVIRTELLHKQAQICNNVLSMLELQKLMMKNKYAAAAPWYIKGMLRHWFKLKLILILSK